MNVKEKIQEIDPMFSSQQALTGGELLLTLSSRSKVGVDISDCLCDLSGVKIWHYSEDLFYRSLSNSSFLEESSLGQSISYQRKIRGDKKKNKKVKGSETNNEKIDDNELNKMHYQWDILLCCAIKKICDKEKIQEINFIARHLSLCVKISLFLGLPLSDLLQHFYQIYRQRMYRENIKKRAFALPKATIKLLLSLPLLVIGAGVLFGTNPLKFLIFTTGGHLCLLVGMFFYVCGFIWVRRILKNCYHE